MFFEHPEGSDCVVVDKEKQPSAGMAGRIVSCCLCPLVRLSQAAYAWQSTSAEEFEVPPRLVNRSLIRNDLFKSMGQCLCAKGRTHPFRRSQRLYVG
jgi:hypothetical protein